MGFVDHRLNTRVEINFHLFNDLYSIKVSQINYKVVIPLASFVELFMRELQPSNYPTIYKTNHDNFGKFFKHFSVVYHCYFI